MMFILEFENVVVTMKSCNSTKKRRWKCNALLILFLLCGCLHIHAQALRGTTGLLHAATADMEKDKTFKFGGNVLDITPLRYEDFDVRYTFNYYLNITIFPWLEVGYTCTLNYANEGSTYFPEKVWGKYSNQDRSFYGRLRVWKEGWWKEWTPQIVLGANDPSTNDILGNSDKDDYGIGGVGEMGNGHWNRYYIAGTKHFYFKNRGELGIHVAYLYNKRKDYHLNGPAVGVNFHFYLSGTNFFVKALNNLNVMAEYDSRTINCGLKYSFWKDYINAVVEMTECKHLSGGVIFKVHLK